MLRASESRPLPHRSIQSTRTQSSARRSARMASSTLKVAIVFCSRSLRGCSMPNRTSALAARWNTTSAPRIASVSAARSSVSPRASVNVGRGKRALEKALLTSREVVEGDDGVAVGKETIDESTPNETSSAGDACAHEICRGSYHATESNSERRRRITRLERSPGLS